MALKQVPDAERCEECVFESYHRYRCDKRAKHTVVAYPHQDWRTGELSGEPREVRLCGVHKRTADRGASLSVYAGSESGMFPLRAKTVPYYTEATEVEQIKAELNRVERSLKWNRGEPENARRVAGRAMFEQAPEILEMLFMVAERGDQRVWQIIDTIQQGLGEVQRADERYQAILQKIADLKARLERAREEQA